MILDTSALVAILAAEPDAGLLMDAIQSAGRCRISAGTYLELAIMLESRYAPGVLR